MRSSDRPGVLRRHPFSWLGALALASSLVPQSAMAQVCGDSPPCGANQTCARGRATTSQASLLDIDLGALRTGDTQCQSAPPNFNVTSPEDGAVSLEPIANVIGNASSTRARVNGERFVQSTGGEATVEVLPGLGSNGVPVLTAVTTGSQATICGDAVDGTAGIELLTINGTPVEIPGDVEPNTEIVPVAPLQLVRLNEQIVEEETVGDCTTRSITVNALRVEVLSGLQVVEIVLSQSYAETTTCGTPDLIEPTNFGAIYGGQPGDAALLPYFEVGPKDTIQAKDTHITIIHDDADLPLSGEFVHWMLFDADSNEACNACVPWTREDVYVERTSNLIENFCNEDGRAMLDAGDGVPDNGVFVGYARFEPSLSPDCSTIDSENDLIAHFYQTNLQIGLASGFNGPVYTPGGFEEFALLEGDPLYFRILVGLGEPAGQDDNATTRLWIWSDTSGACGALPDSSCLEGPGAEGVLRVCDEEENCTSQVRPSFRKEVNVKPAEDFVPNVFVTDGGWLSLVARPTIGDRLNVLGYSDNQASGLGATLNWQSIFPAQRTQVPLECR